MITQEQVTIELRKSQLDLKIHRLCGHISTQLWGEDYEWALKKLQEAIEERQAI